MVRLREYYQDPNTPRAHDVLPAAFAAVRNRAGELLLVRRIDDGNWELPGGRIEVGETAAALCDRVYVMYAGRIVESASAASVFGSPQHPYTAGLLASTPDLSGAHRRLVPIPGAPLSLLEQPLGCAFAARCAFAVDACQGRVPQLVSVGDHAVRCLRAAELAPTLAGLVARDGGAA